MKTYTPLNLSLATAVTAAITASVCSTSASAGELLRMKSGNLQLATGSATLQGFEDQVRVDRYFIMQFKDAIVGADREALAALGATVLRYIPDDAYLVRVKDQAGAERLRDFAAFAPQVQGIIAYLAEFKQSPELADLSIDNPKQKAQLIVGTFDMIAASEVYAELQTIPGLDLVSTGKTDFVVNALPEKIAQIAQIPGVEWVQENPLMVTMEYNMEAELLDRRTRRRPRRPVETTQAPVRALVPPTPTGYESGTKLMGFDAAWDRGFTGKGQIASMADTGMDTGVKSTLHPDLKPAFKSGYAMGLGGKSWEDSHGHGTHVAGSIVGRGSSSEGRLKGGAYEAEFVALGMWSPLLNNLAPPSNYAKLVVSAVKDGVTIHSNSWGSPQNLGEYDLYASRVDEFLWENLEFMSLFAAGNSGIDGNADGRIDEGSVSSPATAKNVLSVGASENLLAVGGIQRKLSDMRDGAKHWGTEPVASDTLSNNPKGIAAFSSRGPTKDGRLKPEVVAPGTNIVSTRSKHPEAVLLWGEYDENYVYAGGTSMATPLAAGAATVVRQYLVENRKIAKPTASLVKATLMHTAFDLFPGQYGEGTPTQELRTRRPNMHEGYGRVNVDAATALTDSTLVIDDREGVKVNEGKEYTITVKEGQLRATLSYTDAPGTVAAAKALVNDIDLVLMRADGSVVKQTNDRLNNSEMIEFSDLASGNYRVAVKGINIPRGRWDRQPYALVVSAQ